MSLHRNSTRAQAKHHKVSANLRLFQQQYPHPSCSNCQQPHMRFLLLSAAAPQAAGSHPAKEQIDRHPPKSEQRQPRRQLQWHSNSQISEHSHHPEAYPTTQIQPSHRAKATDWMHRTSIHPYGPMRFQPTAIHYLTDSVQKYPDVCSPLLQCATRLLKAAEFLFVQTLNSRPMKPANNWRLPLQQTPLVLRT